MSKPTYGSLFSGIGGIDLGLDRAGFDCRFQVEIDPTCRAVLAHHWPGVPRYSDIKDVDVANLPPVDLVAGGFPCQPASVAGKRRGTADTRWLWPEFARIVDGIRPRHVLVENVPGLLSVNGGDAFAEVLGGLGALGYDAEWEVIPASFFGATHQRKRLYLVAYANGFPGVFDPHRLAHAGCQFRRTRWPEPRSDQSLPDLHDQRRLAEMGHSHHTGLQGWLLAQRRSPDQRSAWPPGPTEHAAWTAILAADPGLAPAVETPPQPALRRVADGVPGRLAGRRGLTRTEKLKMLGNAVVPAAATYVGLLIRQHMASA